MLRQHYVKNPRLWGHCSNAGLIWSLFRLHLLWKNGRQQSVKLRLFPECMFYSGCLMPVSSGICQQKMLDAKFVERKVYLGQSCLSGCIRDRYLHFPDLFSPKKLCAQLLNVWGWILPSGLWYASLWNPMPANHSRAFVTQFWLENNGSWFL